MVSTLVTRWFTKNYGFVTKLIGILIIRLMGFFVERNVGNGCGIVERLDLDRDGNV